MRAIALTAGGTLALLASACERTESQSAKLAREGAGLIAATRTAKLGGVNHEVRVVRTALVRGTGRIAVAVQLASSATRAQVDVPVLIDVRGASGASLYSNDVQGNQTSLHELTLLRARGRAWWVDDQVLAASTPRSVSVRVGNPQRLVSEQSSATAASRNRTGKLSSEVQLRNLQLGSDIGGPYLTGVVVNRSGVAQRELPIYAVALRGARVTAAGRALVPSLPAGATKQPTVFRIYFVGNPSAARIELTTAPTIQP